MHWLRSTLVSLIACSTWQPLHAAMQENKSTSIPGLTYIHRYGFDSLGKKQSYHILLVNLRQDGIRVRPVLNQDKWGGTKQTLSQMAQKHGAIAGINGDYWNIGTSRALPQGSLVINGYCYRAHPQRTAIAFDGDQRRVEIGIFGTWPISEPPDDCPDWAEQALGAGPQFIFAGQAKWLASKNKVDTRMVDINRDSFFGPEAARWNNGRDPQSAIGVSKDRRTLILVTCDGRSAGGTAGCRMMYEMSDIMREFGAHDAMKLDGGGSTTFYYDRAIRNMPSEGSQRALANALLIFAN